MELQFLNVAWFVLIVVLFSGFIILDGFDFGVGMLHGLAKTDEQKRMVMNSIGPVWDGNEVWLITAGGALFAAFPHAYATVFSGFYIAFFLFLTALIARAASMEFRSKSDSPGWRGLWDGIFNIFNYVIPLLLGVAFGNIITGVPIGSNMEYAGTFLTLLLNPFALILGVTSIFLLRMHGGIYLAMKTEGDLEERASSSIKPNFFVFLGLYAVAHAYAIFTVDGITENLLANPIWFIVPALIVVSLILIPLFVGQEKYMRAFIFSSLLIALSITLAAIGIFPDIVHSTINPDYSLNIMNAASSQTTLKTMFIIACIGVPLVLTYSIIVYTVFAGKVKIDSSSY